MNYQTPGLISTNLLTSVQGEDGSGQPGRRLLCEGGRQISPEVSPVTFRHPNQRRSLQKSLNLKGIIWPDWICMRVVSLDRP
jgi:hypothetical protein